MTVVHFPNDQIVGTIQWVGSWSDAVGPILATGAIEVPTGQPIDLEVAAIAGKAPSRGGGWTVTGKAQEFVR